MKVLQPCHSIICLFNPLSEHADGPFNKNLATVNLVIALSYIGKSTPVRKFWARRGRDSGHKKSR